jgi:hypothetical protein
MMERRRTRLRAGPALRDGLICAPREWPGVRRAITPVLEQHMPEFVGPEPGALVFCGVQGGPQMPPNTLLWSPQLHRGWPAGRRRRHGRQRRGWRGPCPYPLAAEDSGGADQGEMGECLREVADLPAPGDVVLLGVQAEVVAQGEEPLEQLPRRAGRVLGRAAVRVRGRAG